MNNFMQVLTSDDEISITWTLTTTHRNRELACWIRGAFEGRQKADDHKMWMLFLLLTLVNWWINICGSCIPAPASLTFLMVISGHTVGEVRICCYFPLRNLHGRKGGGSHHHHHAGVICVASPPSPLHYHKKWFRTDWCKWPSVLFCH